MENQSRKTSVPAPSLRFPTNGSGNRTLVRCLFCRTPFPVVVIGLGVFLHAFSLVPVAQAQDEELCVVQTPLKSPYFIPSVSNPAPCQGCSFPLPRSSPIDAKPIRIDGEEEIVPSAVHIVRVRNPQGGVFEITLQRHSRGTDLNEGLLNGSHGNDASDVIGRTWVALILSPETSQAPPTSYVIYDDSAHRNFSILLMIRSIDRADLSRVPVRTHVRVVALNGTEATIESAKKTFGRVSSYTEAAEANSIVLLLDRVPSESEEHDCNGEVNGSNPFVECFNVVKKQTSGCYHDNMIGVNERDIHIIETETTSNLSLASILLRVEGLHDLSDSESRTHVLKTKSEEEPDQKSGSGGNAIKRNLTLVLRSNQPTSWRLSVANLQGFITLLVGAEDQVENRSSSGEGIGVAVKRLELPRSFDQMILHVLSSIGLPVSYTKTRAPDVITVVVATKRELTVVRSTAPKEPIVNAMPPENANALIDNHVSRECGTNQVLIALPKWVAERVGGVTMTLRDPSCRGTKNDTHFLLISQYSECGFMQEIMGSTTVYTNFAHIHVGSSMMPMGMGLSDDEDFEGSGYGLEDHYRVRIPTVVVRCKKENPNSPYDRKSSPGNVEDAVRYDLEAYQDKTFSFPFREFPVVLPQDGTIYAKISFSKDIPSHLLRKFDLKLLIEKCWLSPSNGVSQNRLILIRKSCAVDQSIRMEWDYFTGDLKLSLQPSPMFLQAEKIHLYCQVGLCSQDSLPKPATKKCVDPQSYCTKHSLVDIFRDQVVASHVTTLMIGPFILQPSKEALSSLRFETEVMTSLGKDLNAAGNENLPSHGFGPGKRKSPIIVMEGLSTEIVVAIAVASFVIGVCLTATLWLIYMKTDPRRQKRPESEVPRNSGYDLSAHSGSSTPSSQAPMTA